MIYYQLINLFQKILIFLYLFKDIQMNLYKIFMFISKILIIYPKLIYYNLNYFFKIIIFQY